MSSALRAAVRVAPLPPWTFFAALRVDPEKKLGGTRKSRLGRGIVFLASVLAHMASAGFSLGSYPVTRLLNLSVNRAMRRTSNRAHSDPEPDWLLPLTTHNPKTTLFGGSKSSRSAACLPH